MHQPRFMTPLSILSLFSGIFQIQFLCYKIIELELMHTVPIPSTLRTRVSNQEMRFGCFRIADAPTIVG